MPDYSHEQRFSPAHVCGVDEAGRGPWAGPVVASAVLFLDATTIPTGLNDSKKLSRRAREALALELHAHPDSILIGVGVATAEEIDRLNIWQATITAMRRAVEALPMMPEMALVDGKIAPKPFPCATMPLVGGDAISLSIAAASIIAKTTRDRMMEDYATLYPHYGFDSHAGYGTAAHQDALRQHGPCPIHRRSYKPIRALLGEAA